MKGRGRGLNFGMVGGGGSSGEEARPQAEIEWCWREESAEALIKIKTTLWLQNNISNVLNNYKQFVCG